MSYRQLARMAPTILSVHRVLVIRLKTHFAKDLLDRYVVARLTWQWKAQDLSSAQPAMTNSVAPRSPLPRQDEIPWRVSLANPACYRVMPVSYHCNRIDLKINSGKRLMLRRQQQPVGQQARPADQGALGRHPRQLRKIIAFR